MSRCLDYPVALLWPLGGKASPHRTRSFASILAPPAARCNNTLILKAANGADGWQTPGRNLPRRCRAATRRGDASQKVLNHSKLRWRQRAQLNQIAPNTANEQRRCQALFRPLSMKNPHETVLRQLGGLSATAVPRPIRPLRPLRPHGQRPQRPRALNRRITPRLAWESASVG